RLLSQPAQPAAIKIDHHQIVRLHHSLADSGGGNENAVRAETHGNVSVGGSNVAAIANPTPHGADVAAVFCLSFHSPVRYRFRVQGRLHMWAQARQFTRKSPSISRPSTRDQWPGYMRRSGCSHCEFRRI